ncbi:hypothetical protein ACWEQA_23770 [Nocardia sp. NPDC004085]
MEDAWRIKLREIATEKRGWWMKYPALIRPEMQRLYGLEYGAHSIRCYNALPGEYQVEGECGSQGAEMS